MDSLDKVVSLMGSLLGCPIAFIFPPLIHLKLDEHITPARKRGDQIVVAAGFCAMILASAITLLTW
jgi:solute carrier family 36 (proton-coupled amino acid transporter)